jgi:hypothetical protein
MEEDQSLQRMEETIFSRRTRLFVKNSCSSFFRVISFCDFIDFLPLFYFQSARTLISIIVKTEEKSVYLQIKNQSDKITYFHHITYYGHNYASVNGFVPSGMSSLRD